MTHRRWLAPAIILATFASATTLVLAQAPPVLEEGGTPPPSVRDLELRVLVEGDPVELLEAWLDPERVDRFFGAGSTIEPRLGGRYEIRFLPGEDPESRANSTRGSRILALKPGRHLAFGWRVPPWAAEPARSAPATRVDVRLERADDPAGGGRTVLHLRHRGFGDGPAWDQVRSFFQRSWFEILDRYCDLVGASSGAGQQRAATEPAGPEIRAQFGRLVGDWDVRQWRMDANGTWPTDPSPARWMFRYVLDGHAIQDSWIEPPPDEPLAGGHVRQYGTNLRMYDAERDRWNIVWTSSDDPRPITYTATREGDDLVVVGDYEGERPSRIVFFDIRNDSFRWRLEFETGNGWRTVSRIEATRR